VRAALRALLRNPAAMAALGVLAVLVLVSALASLLAPFAPLLMNPKQSLATPSWSHLLGTDLFGRDVLSRLLYGGRITLAVAGAAVAVSAPVGVALGLVSGYAGGQVDSILMRLVDMLLAFPRILLALCVVAVLGVGSANVVLAVGISGISGYARLVRSAVLSAKELPYVEAAKVTGCSSVRVMVRHLLPNVLAPILVLATLDVGSAVLSGSSLSFLGVGAQPPAPEWGLMLNEGRAHLMDAPWTSLAPGLAIMLAVLAVNLLGDGLRDALDPRVRM
jgi:peptide/nickel transport system permease protein